MPVFSYTVVSGLPPGPSSSSDPALSPDDGLTSICIPDFQDQQEFLDLFDRLVPFEYIEPLKNTGPGYELFQMFAKVGERISLAIGNTECSLYIIYSHGGFKATGLVEFFRPSIITGAFTLKRGTIVRATDTNREFELIDDLAFSASDLILQAEVRALQADAAFNLDGPETTLGGELLTGEIDEVSLPLMDPPFAERDIQVRQATDTVNGQAPVLDQLGDDRSIDRETIESDDQYRVRIRQLPDTISPDALVRQLNLIFQPLGLSFDFIETWENRYQAGWDGPDSPITNPVVGDYNPNLFVYDDPRSNPPFRNRWMGPDDHVGGIIVVVPNVTSFAARGFVLDDTALTVADHASAFGRRSHSAFDIPSIPLDTSITLPAALGAGDEGKNNFYKQIADRLQKTKAGGVLAIVELEGQ